MNTPGSAVEKINTGLHSTKDGAESSLVVRGANVALARREVALRARIHWVSEAEKTREGELAYPAVVERDGAGLAAPVRDAQKAAGGVIATWRHAVGARRYKPVAAVQRSPPERTQQSSAPAP